MSEQLAEIIASGHGLLVDTSGPRVEVWACVAVVKPPPPVAQPLADRVVPVDQAPLIRACAYCCNAKRAALMRDADGSMVCRDANRCGTW